MIKMQVIGRLGKDCVVNTVNAKSVINFAVAHSEKYKDSSGNNQEKTIWVDCAYWTDRTAIAPYLVKGTQVYVEGTPEVRSFQRNDGTAGSSLSMRIRDVQLLGSKNEGNNKGSQQGSDSGSSYNRQDTAPAPAGMNSEDMADDLPF